MYTKYCAKVLYQSQESGFQKNHCVRLRGGCGGVQSFAYQLSVSWRGGWVGGLTLPPLGTPPIGPNYPSGNTDGRGWRWEMGVGSGLQLRSFCLYSFSKEAWNPHPAMEYGIYWFTGTRESHSVLLSPVLCEEKGLTKTEGLLEGVPPTAPLPPRWTLPLSKTLCVCVCVCVRAYLIYQSFNKRGRVPRLSLLPLAYRQANTASRGADMVDPSRTHKEHGQFDRAGKGNSSRFGYLSHPNLIDIIQFELTNHIHVCAATQTDVHPHQGLSLCKAPIRVCALSWGCAHKAVPPIGAVIVFPMVHLFFGKMIEELPAFATSGTVF